MANVLEGIATSDFHFGGLEKHFPDHIERQIYELDKIYQYAIDNGVEHVMVPGDISDTPNMSSDVYVALLMFLKKYDGIIHTYYIAGNHDFSDIKKTSMDLLNLIYQQGFFKTFHMYLQADSAVIDGVPVNFLPFPCLEAPESNIPHLNLSHVSYNGALTDNGRKLRVKDEFIQNPGDFNISGHIHMYQYLKSSRAVYCGNPFQKNFGEKLPKGWIHFKAKASKTEIDFKHKFIRNKPDFRFENVVIESRVDFSKLSTSDSIRYKLWVDPSVEIPKDLRVKYPNITGGIFDLNSKKQAEVQMDEITSTSSSGVSRINLRSGLTKRLKSEGYNKAQCQSAHQIVRIAANELGIALEE